MSRSAESREVTNQLSLEFGAKYPGFGYPCDDVTDCLAARDRLEKKYGGRIDLNLIPYESTRSGLCGGRVGKLSLEDLIGLIHCYNREEVSFMYALNGGMGLSEGEEVDFLRDERYSTEREVLECLAENSAEHKVKNYVTILRDEVLAAVREQFPDLTTVASCIRFVGGRKGRFNAEQEYPEALEKFDLVVPLNQHTTAEFLGKYREQMKKMVLFYDLKCASGNLLNCFNHYVKSESWLGEGTDSMGIDKNDFSFIPSRLPMSESCFGSRSELRERLPDLREFLQGGVRYFKIPRDAGPRCLNADYLAPLLDEFDRLIQTV